MNKWIPVSEALPPTDLDECVLVTVSGNYDKRVIFENAIEIANYYEEDGWELEAYPDWETPNVTAWQPLPEPYEGGAEE